jgi:GNAT superfamily N-acetyltransferase
VRHTESMIGLGTSADLPAAGRVYRSASLHNEGDRENLLTHPEYLILGPDGLAEGRTYVAELDGQLVGFATWAETAGQDGSRELEDLFTDPSYMRRGIASALVRHITGVLREHGVKRLEVSANPHALDFYHSAGFTECGVVETAFYPGSRMVLDIG